MPRADGLSGESARAPLMMNAAATRALPFINTRTTSFTVCLRPHATHTPFFFFHSYTPAQPCLFVHAMPKAQATAYVAESHAAVAYSRWSCCCRFAARAVRMARRRAAAFSAAAAASDHAAEKEKVLRRKRKQWQQPQQIAPSYVVFTI